jgi:hypothetical protein
MVERIKDNATGAGSYMAELVLKLSQQLSQMKWPPRVLEAFSHEQMLFLGDLCTSNDKALRRNPGIGNKTIENLRDSLRQVQLDIGMNLPWWSAIREELAVTPA